MFWNRKPDPLMDHIRNGEWKLLKPSTMTSGDMTLEWSDYIESWSILYPVKEHLPARYHRAATRTLKGLIIRRRRDRNTFLQSYIRGDWPYRLTLKDVDEELPGTYQSGDVWFFRDREQAMMAMLKWGVG